MKSKRARNKGKHGQGQDRTLRFASQKLLALDSAIAQRVIHKRARLQHALCENQGTVHNGSLDTVSVHACILGVVMALYLIHPKPYADGMA